MKLQELNNKEIVFLDIIISDLLLSLDEIVKEKGMFKILDTPIGEVNVFMSLPDHFINEIEMGLKYKVLSSLNQKISPIAELINESNPSILEELEAALKDREDHDEDEEEDL
jgi:hypothetical protein